MLTAELQIILDFLEGRITPIEFEELLYTNANLKSLLDDDPNLPANSYVGNSVYLFLLQCNYKSPGGSLNAQGALTQWLKRKGISFQATPRHQNLHQLILEAQPKWLSVDVSWLQQKVLADAGTRTGKELKTWLRARLLELFQFVGKPPQWIQNPNWPISENGPLVFLGQIKVSNYFHDEGAVYVFHDQKTGAYEIVEQVY